MTVVLVGAVPVWQYSKGRGYAPVGIVGTDELVPLTMLLLGRI
jgi:hypothetical protein